MRGGCVPPPCAALGVGGGGVGFEYDAEGGEYGG